MGEELIVAVEEFRYVLLCRHARHDQGRLVPLKGEDGLWRFPSESVASVLAEELVIGRDGLRLAKVVYAPTPEASRTANLLLRGLEGYTRVADDKAPAQPDSPAQPGPAHRGGTVTIAAPTWLPGPKQDDQTKLVVPYESWDELLPNQLYQTKSGAATRIDKEVEQLGNGSKNAVLVVGHQPQMGWLSSYLSRRRRSSWRSGALPMAPSEVICLRLQQTKNGWRGRLCWQLVPDDSKALDAVADKVKGKMESAKLLSAVITLALAALLGVLLDTSHWTGLASPKASLAGLSYNGQAAIKVAFVLLLAALALYLLTMYYYDRLLMPPRFWAERPDRSDVAAPNVSQDSTAQVYQRDDERRSVRNWLVEARRAGLPRRPPSSSAWVVFRNMQRTWFWLFTPGNVLVGLALAILAAALLRLDGWVWAVVAVFGLFVGFWAWWFRPILGSED
jgi:hypothetical protein